MTTAIEKGFASLCAYVSTVKSTVHSMLHGEEKDFEACGQALLILLENPNQHLLMSHIRTVEAKILESEAESIIGSGGTTPFVTQVMVHIAETMLDHARELREDSEKLLLLGIAQGQEKGAKTH